MYQRSCASCHGPDGEGRVGVFPPLAGSSWVAGDPRTAVRILLHGLVGPVEVGGRSYDGVMPAFRARLSDREIAAVLTHVRSSFADASPITAEEVASVRSEVRGRRDPWTVSELR